MEYENIDETTRRKAYEQVQKLAEAIIKIRKKYYLCFNKISDVDKKRYEELKAQMQVIANENGISEFSKQIIRETENQYGDSTSDKKNDNFIEQVHQRYLRAVQFLAEITVMVKNSTDSESEKAYLKKAHQVQKEIKKMVNTLKEVYSEKILVSEKRKAFSEKFQQQAKTYFSNLFKKCYKVVSKNPLALGEGTKSIESCTNTKENKEQAQEISLA